MAKTFIGELILKLRDDMSGAAKRAAAQTNGAIDSIERAAAKLNSAKWGSAFEMRLQKLGASASDLDRLRASWDRLHASMDKRGLASGPRAAEIASWKTASTGYVASLRAMAAEADKAGKRLGGLRGTLSGITTELRQHAQFFATGALLYGGVSALRGGVVANAEFARERWRQSMANVPEADQQRMLAEADRLSTQYPSAGITQILELARNSRAMMGTTERGLAILPDLVRGLVALQSTKDGRVASDTLVNLLRGIDNAGKNTGDQIGINDTREIIAGMIRAAQTDSDVDPGKLFQFARRGKIAVPGLSTEFLATATPAFAQDMTPEGFGTALSSAYQAFVIGSNAVASKKNVQAQVDLGIRKNGSLVDAETFGTNPYQWVKAVLIPALQKKGVDTENETQVAMEIAKLTRNTNASGLLTRMITQQKQVDRALQQYAEAMGPEAADQARFEDPFLAAKGFRESLRELATAVAGMPQAVGVLNSLTDGLQRFATALREQDPMAQAGLLAGGVVGAYGTWKAASAVFGLITAGTNLNAAAIALEAAAVSLGGQGVAGNAGDIATKAGKGGFLAAALKFLPHLTALGAIWGGSTSFKVLPDDKASEVQALQRSWDNAREAGARRSQMERLTIPPPKNTPGISRLFEDIAAQSRQTGEEIKAGLNVTARPAVDNSALRETLALVRSIASGLSGLGPAAMAANARVAREMNRNMADHGVAP